MGRIKIDIYLGLICILIALVFKAPSYAFLPVIPILFISYYRILTHRDLTTVLILMLSARLIMGPFVINSNLSFNILNVLCNYLPVLMILGYNFFNLKSINIQKILSLKWTFLYVTFILLFSLLHISFAISVFAQEILPLILFLLVIVSKSGKKLDYYYLLKFFRYTFITCVIIYIIPDFYTDMRFLFANGIIFKEATPMISLEVYRAIPRLTGFVFDFRIMGQLACLYFILLYYLGKKNYYWDIALLSTVAILSFSRGPLLILGLLFIGAYAPQKIKITKRLLIVFFSTFIAIVVGVIFIMNNHTLQKFTSSFNPFAEDNAISQRSAFTIYSLDRFYKQPLGSGIGALSSPGSDVKVFAGLTNFHKKVPDKIFYYKVGDAYLALSLAEKGIIGFILMLLSFSELFFSNRNRISLFFLIGFYINIIGTDIPKEGFFYFIMIYIYWELSQLTKNQKENTSEVDDIVDTKKQLGQKH